MWKFLSPLSCFTTRDFSSRSGGEWGDILLRVRETAPHPSDSALSPWSPRAGRRAGTHTVCDDSAERGSFEVKLNIHVFSLQREARGSLAPLPHRCVEGSGLPRSLSAPPTPPASRAGALTHKSRGVVVADGLGVAERCGDEGRDGEGLQHSGGSDSGGGKSCTDSLSPPPMALFWDEW